MTCGLGVDSLLCVEELSLELNQQFLALGKMNQRQENDDSLAHGKLAIRETAPLGPTFTAFSSSCANNTSSLAPPRIYRFVYAMNFQPLQNCPYVQVRMCHGIGIVHMSHVRNAYLGTTCQDLNRIEGVVKRVLQRLATLESTREMLTVAFSGSIVFLEAVCCLCCCRTGHICSTT